MKLTILDRQILDGIPSASGIISKGNHLYIIGDNSPWIFKLNHQFQLIEKQALFEDVSISIIPKKLKPDFEAMTAIQYGGSTEILVFGSGSKSPTRDLLIRFNPDDSTQTKRYSLEEFYRHIKASSTLNDSTLNIEAAATSDKHLFLFNRGINIILQFDINSFINYIEGKGGLPTFNEYAIQLPTWNEWKATFSGASFIPNTDDFIFTASIEKNKNPIDDGQIVGSYVGIIRTAELMNQYKPDCILIADQKNGLKIKVESVEVISYDTSGKTDLLLVTDSDGGVSEVLSVRLTFNETP